MHLVFTTACAVLPSLLLIRYFYGRDLNPEPRHVLLVTFILGLLTVIPVLLFAMPGVLVLMALEPPPVLMALVMAFGLAALPEEFFKFLVVFGYCVAASRIRRADGRHGVRRGRVARLRHAGEHHVCVAQRAGHGPRTGATAVPCHAFVGAIMGYLRGAVAFRPDASAWPEPVPAPFVPVLLHGLYDFPLMLVESQAGGQEDFDNVSGFVLALLLVPFAVLLLMGIVTLRLSHRLRQLQLRVKAERALGLGESERLPE